MSRDEVQSYIDNICKSWEMTRHRERKGLLKDYTIPEIPTLTIDYTPVRENHQELSDILNKNLLSSSYSNIVEDILNKRPDRDLSFDLLEITRNLPTPQHRNWPSNNSQRVIDILNKEREKRKERKKKPKSPKKNPPPFEFKRSFLMDFADSGEILIYLDRNLYILGQKNSSVKSIVHNNHAYELKKLEDISELEQHLIENNYNRIKKFQEESLLFYSDKDNVRKLMDKINSNNLESFISNYLIPLHIGKETEAKKSSTKSSKKEKEKKKEKLDRNQLREPRLSRGISILEKLVDAIATETKSLEGFALMREGVYILQKGFFRTLFNFSRNLDKATHYEGIEKFEERYLERLSKAFKKTTKKDILSYILKNENNERIIGNTSKKIPSKAGELYFKINSLEECIVYRKTGEYIVENTKKYYHFPSTKIGITLSLINNKVTFSSRSFIYDDPGYRHPFVPSGPSKTKAICLGIGNDQTYREEKGNINPKDSYNNKTARGVLDVLRRAKNVLTCGNTNGNTNATYTTLSQSSGVKISSSKAKSLERKGIPLFHGRKYDE